MAFEPLVEFETKQEALERLVEEGILTQNDYSLCVKAIKKKATEKGLLYRDKFISISYRGYDEQQMYNGNGVRIYFVIENRTKQPITVRARCLVNGVIVERDQTIVSNIPERSKEIAEVILFFDKLKIIDIESINDIEEVAFVFRSVDKTYKELNGSKKESIICLDV